MATYTSQDTETALRVARNVCNAWGLSDHETSTLLGTGDGEQLERISCVIGIYKSLRTIFQTDQQADAWVRRPNRAFGGQTALEVMLNGGLADIRRYLAGQEQ
ncbi:hypothetical protein MSNKSG1_00888 [Marinobacter santoriniensis NKSG1]|uniref:Antitoxin Xre/MbcA/ParS-like toxin-binding domain-containing protein n=1 Tax=Marinobacter santoriniensis NKSG1 TaxID=1288826 RepID=M7CVH5_9GAMM|nr:hypothetical protein MSNKSG1_00888 [Marinobacter santoriniensis NKSG1]